MEKHIVIIESPFRPKPDCGACDMPLSLRDCAGCHASIQHRNDAYLEAAIHDSIARGEVPYASHAFFTQFLDDTVESDRALGIELGLQMARITKHVAVYKDLGLSEGMKHGIRRHLDEGRFVEYRSLPTWQK